MRLSWLLTLLLVLGTASAAMAAGSGSAGSFSCSAGKAVGQLYVSNASCPTTLGMDNLFSFLVCNMEQLSSNVMGHMYCGMIKSLSPFVWASATLAVIIFGIGFTIGIIPLKGGEAIKFLLKIALITGFATNADLLIGVGYTFLISGMRDGVEIVLKGFGGTASSSDSVYKMLDGFLAQAFHYATDGMGGVSGVDRCKNAVFAAMATMALAFPILSYLGLVLLGRLVITFFRAIFAYIYALFGITFLLALSPIFLSFLLFNQTRGFFDKWLGHLASFTLQVIFLFAFLGFILSMEISKSNILSNVSSLVMFNAAPMEGKSIRLPWEYCTLCDFEFVEKGNPSHKLDPKDTEIISKGEMVCKEPKTAITIISASAPGTGTAQMTSLLKLAGGGIFSVIVLAFLIERLLANIPMIAQRLAAGLGGAYTAQLGGGTITNSIHMPGEALIGDFETGFRQNMSEHTYVLSKGSNGITSPLESIKSGISTMISGKRTSGGQVIDVKNPDGSDTGIKAQFKNWLGRPD